MRLLSELNYPNKKRGKTMEKGKGRDRSEEMGKKFRSGTCSS